MDHIIAGRFRSDEDAFTVAALIARYIDPSDIYIFQHVTSAPVADQREGQDAETGVKEIGKTAVGTALAAGTAAGAIGALGGPVVALVAAGTGAYLGSLLGTLGAMEQDKGEPVTFCCRQEGIMVSVRIKDPRQEARVIATLRSEGAADVEQASGTWSEGRWLDFNPLSEPQLIEDAPNWPSAANTNNVASRSLH